MKKMRKGLALLLMTALAALCLAIAACAGGITFKFVTNGGDPLASESVVKGEEFTLPVPEREGYSFEGWYDNADLSGDPVAETQTVEKSRTFYAKWEKMYLVTFDVAGGSISAGSLYLKKGTNLNTAIKEYVPEKEDFLFGEWLYNGSALKASDVMPEEDITLTAHYKVSYTVERHLQSLDDPAVYEAGESYTGYAYAGSSLFEPDAGEVAPEGFVAASHEGEVTQKALSENPAENTFKMYFDRKEVRVLLSANYPDGSEETAEITGRYGAKVLLPESGFYARGYCLTGWSTSLSGTAEGEEPIPSNYLKTFLFGGEDEELFYFELKEETLLYGIWTKGYIDNFESTDYIYRIPTEEGEEVYLERAGIFFKGEYDAPVNGFLFRYGGADGKVILEGNFNDENGTFVYYVQSRQRNLSRYVMGTGLDADTVLILDEYNNLSYVRNEDNGEGGKTVVAKSDGTYTYLGGVEYEATFTSGELEGTSFVFMQGTATVNNVETPVFSVRDDASYSMGTLAYAGMYRGAPLVYPNDLNALRFNGYGVAAMNLGTSTANYYYRFESETTFNLYDTSTGSLLDTCMIVSVDGQRAYSSYNSSFDNTFTSGTEKLTLDGLYNATYTGAVSVKGYYTYTASAFGGYIVTMTVPNSTDRYIFHVYATQEPVDNQVVVEYRFDRKALGYGEYYYKDDAEGVYFHYAPLIVLNSSVEGDFALYGIDPASFTTRVFVKVATGTYAEEENGRFRATIAQYVEGAAYLETPIDITNLEEIVFDTAYVSRSNGGTSPIAYWYSVKYKEAEEESFDVVYTEQDGESSLHSTLSLIAGFAILSFEADGEEVRLMGSYVRSENILVLVTSSGSLALEMNDEEKSYFILSSMMGTMYAMGEDGVETRNEFFDFDGRNGAVYTVVTPAEAEGGDATLTSYEGTFEDTGRQTFAGERIYHFTGTLNGDADAQTMEFDFLVLTVNNTRLFAKHNEAYEGEYLGSGAEGGTLTLDGYGYRARLTVGGNRIDGYYYLRDKEENVICFIASGAMFFFDVTVDKTFTQRGNEFASYFLMRNQGIGDESLHLDGHGNFTVTRLSDGEELYGGTYTYETSGSTALFTLVYLEGAQQHTIRGILSSITLETCSGSVSYNTFVVYDEDIVTLLVDEAQLAVLVLDGFGNALRYNNLGMPELGQYVVINEFLLYYVNSAGSDACIYTYDLEEGTAVPSDFTPRSYFTKDLDAMVFYNYGFMIYGGETQYYYNIKDQKVYLYHRDEDDPKANKYGFVEEEFGAFGSSVTWKDKTYYLTNGYRLTFARDGENKDAYPLTMSDGTKMSLEELAFTPTGATEFRVQGSVVLNGQGRACYIERTQDEEGNLTMTLTVSSYRFGLSLEYEGETESGVPNNTYTLSSMQFYEQLPSSVYLYNVFLYAMQGLAQPQNVFGVITIADTYDEAGDVVSHRASGEFAAYSGLTDSAGELISFTDTEYTLEGGLYTVEVKGSDSATYRLHFTVDGTFTSIFGLYSYNVFAFTRAETLTDGEYEMEVERVIATDDDRVNVGGVYDVKLKKNGEAIEATEAYFNSDDLVITHIVRTYDGQGLRTGATYYVIKLTEKTTEGAEEVLEVPFLSGATVTEKQVSTVNGVETNTYADYTTDADGKVTVEMVVFQGAAYFAESTEDRDGVLHVTTKSGRHFTVNLEDRSIALVTDTDEEAE